MQPQHKRVSCSSRDAGGPNGRYITPSTGGDIQEPVPSAPNSSVPATPINIQRSEQEPATNLDLAELYAEQHVAFSPYSKTSPTGSAATSHNWYSAYVNFHSASFHRSVDEPATPSSMVETAPRLANNELWNKRQYAPSLIDHLIQVYLTEFHTLCPILDKHHFLMAVQNGTVSPALMSSVLFVATSHCDVATITSRMGFVDRADASDTHFNEACAAFDADRVMHRPTLIVCAFLLHYWFGRPSLYRDTAWWLGTAIRTAQSLRYHRTDDTDDDATESSTRRRVWWCLYVSRGWPAPWVGVADMTADPRPSGVFVYGQSTDRQ
ncbi:hypothetical protein PRZ48_005332 [Zasmidium cellare]|uniref:Xylanolytic transcriptional activator regulatory domain-containing protein n=1 Tax=Zasmidium cellare TaxID=395010 RepID=A0ABR0ET88_ZASCE|nr:hypothetical protein PRZ48_005332 [Zasmidium cellare]